MASIDFSGVVSAHHPSNMRKGQQEEEGTLSTTLTLSEGDSVKSPQYPSGLSAADIFYAQMNGENLAAPQESSTSDTMDDIIIQDLTLVERKEDKSQLQHDEEKVSTDASSEDDGCSFADLELPDQSGWADNATSSSCSASVISELTEKEVMTIEEFGVDLLKHLPDEVKDSIPADVWEKIFKRSSLVEATKGGSAKSSTSKKTDTTKKTFKKKISILKNSFQASEEDQARSPNRPPEPLLKLNVQFSIVEVRYYERALDNNPSVANGAAIGIGWRYKRARNVSVDDWELQRSYDDRLSSTPTVLSRQDREDLLKYWGYTKKDIAVATRNILKAKNARRVTVQNLDCQSMEEAVENTARCVKGLLRGRFKSATAA